MMDISAHADVDAREIMQKAYVTYATVTHIKGEDGQAARARWPDLVQEVVKSHSKYIGEFAEGKFYDGIENDPRASKEPDEKTSLTSLSGYTPGLSKQKTFVSDQGRAVRPISEGAE